MPQAPADSALNLEPGRAGSGRLATSKFGSAASKTAGGGGSRPTPSSARRPRGISGRLPSGLRAHVSDPPRSTHSRPVSVFPKRSAT